MYPKYQVGELVRKQPVEEEILREDMVRKQLVREELVAEEMVGEELVGEELERGVTCPEPVLSLSPEPLNSMA